MSGTAFVTNPYVYLKKEDLSQGHLQITRVLRSDGKSLPEENYWIDQTSEDNGHTWNYYFHIFDTSINPIQDLSYCFYYEEIDDTEPPHTIVIIGDPKVGEDPVYVNRDTQFTFRADDDASETGTSGIKDMRFALDTEEEGPAPNPFMFSQRMDVDEGHHTLSYRSIDNMGNEEPVNTLSTVLDLTPPLIQDAYVTPQTIMPGAPQGTVVNREAVIVLQITDESGLIDVQIDITDGGNFDMPLRRIKKQFPSGGADIVWNGKDNTNNILSPGIYNLRITASDLLGNVTTQEGLSITITSSLSEGPLPNGLPRMRLYKVAPTEASDPQDQINPDINQDGTIVWQDYRNGNWDIYQFDGLFVTQVTTDTGAQENPAISGDTIVWQDYRSGDWDIYYKTGTNPETGLILSGDQIYPDISENRIVFEENGNIYLHTIGGDTEQITSHIRDQILPAIDQDIIVWQDSRYGDPLIYAYDIANQTETQITPVDEEHHARHLSPTVSGDYILWTDNRRGDYNIYMYKLSEGSTQQLTCGPEDQTDPRVSGHHFVYIDQLDIAFGNTISSISERIMIDPFQQKNVSLSGDGPYTLVWQDNRSGHWEIYRGVIEQDDFYIQIHEGLNLVSLPIEKLPSSQNASDLYNTLHAENGIERLLQYDITEKHYLRIDDTGGEFTLLPKAGYALYGTKKSILSVPNVQDQGTVDLLTGFNQIGLAAIPAGFTAYDLIDSLGALNIKMVQKFSSKDQRYMTINITTDGGLIGSNFPIYSGDGLNIVMRRPVSDWRPGRI